VLLIGDALHAANTHLTSGARIAIEGGMEQSRSMR
jgi:hypothetical protein